MIKGLLRLVCTVKFYLVVSNLVKFHFIYVTLCFVLADGIWAATTTSPGAALLFWLCFRSVSFYVPVSFWCAVARGWEEHTLTWRSQSSLGPLHRGSQFGPTVGGMHGGTRLRD